MRYQAAMCALLHGKGAAAVHRGTVHRDESNTARTIRCGLIRWCLLWSAGLRACRATFHVCESMKMANVSIPARYSYCTPLRNQVPTSILLIASTAFSVSSTCTRYDLTWLFLLGRYQERSPSRRRQRKTVDDWVDRGQLGRRRCDARLLPRGRAAPGSTTTSARPLQSVPCA